MSSSGEDTLAPLESNTNVKSPPASKRYASPGKSRWRLSLGNGIVKTGTKSKRSSLSFGKQDALEALKELQDSDAPPLDSTRSSSEAVWREKNGKVVIVQAQIPFLVRSLLMDKSDQNYLEYFLSTYEYFLDTIDLLQMLIDLYHSPPDIGTSTDELDAFGSKVILQLRIINVLKKIGDHKYNTHKGDPKWLTIFSTFVSALEKGTEIERSCALRLQLFASSKSNISTFVTAFPTFDPEKGSQFDFLMADPKVIAKQLCLLDLKMIKAIPVEELHHKRFEEKSSNASTVKTNMAKAVDSFNQTSYWLASYFFITDNPKDRLQILCKYIQIMDYCLHFNNFNGVMKIFSALNMTPVSCLANYWSELPPEFTAIWERIQVVMNHGYNYKSYREMIEKAKPPCIPYLGLILRDLIYIEELDTKVGDMVNWEKMNLLGKTFSTFTKFQKQIAPFEEDPVIFNFFGDISGSKGVLFDEAVLYEISKEAKADVVKSAPSTLRSDGPPSSGRTRLNSSSDSFPSSPTSRDKLRGSFNRSAPHFDYSDTGSEVSDSEISTTETNDISDWEDETSFSLLMGANASTSMSTSNTSRSEKSRADNSYHLPFWVKKREVTTVDGQMVVLEDIFDKSTVVFVLLRQFGWKSAGELAQVKPFFDLLGVKLVAIGNGTPAMARDFKEDRGFTGEIYVDQSKKIYDDFKCTRGWKNALFNSKTLKTIKNTFKEGYAQGPTQGDMQQNGGTFILKDFRIIYEHIEKFAGDHPDVIQLLQIVGADQGLIERVYLETPKLRKKKAKLERKIEKYQRKLNSITEDLEAHTETTSSSLSKSMDHPPRAASDSKFADLIAKKKRKSEQKKKAREESINQSSKRTRNSVESLILRLKNPLRTGSDRAKKGLGFVGSY